MPYCPSPLFFWEALVAGAAQSLLSYKSVLILWQILTAVFVPC